MCVCLGTYASSFVKKRLIPQDVSHLWVSSSIQSRCFHIQLHWFSIHWTWHAAMTRPFSLLNSFPDCILFSEKLVEWSDVGRRQEKCVNMMRWKQHSTRYPSKQIYLLLSTQQSTRDTCAYQTFNPSLILADDSSQDFHQLCQTSSPKRQHKMTRLTRHSKT